MKSLELLKQKIEIYMNSNQILLEDDCGGIDTAYVLEELYELACELIKKEEL